MKIENFLKISIYSIQSALYEGEAGKLICETPQGQITVLDNHIPLITKLTGPAVEVVGADGGKKVIPLTAGFVEVRPGSEVIVLAHTS